MKKWLLIAILLLIGSLANLGAVLAQETTPEPVPVMPTFDQLENGWAMLIPGGSTICARGTPYAFFVHRGDPSKLMVYFQGGGGCWNTYSCSSGADVFKDSVQAGELDIYRGIFDFEQPENPFRDYTFVVAAYCSADFFTGNTEQVYSPLIGDDIAISHRGAINTAAVLDWTYENIPAPDSLVIAGSSAGAIGAYAHAERILEHYTSVNPDLEALVFGDAGIGVSGELIGDPWGFAASMPAEMTLEDMNIHAVMDAFTERLISRYPTVPIVGFTTIEDSVQVYFYELLTGLIPTGGQTHIEAWQARVRDYFTRLSAAPNYHYYIADGDQHTILAYPNFYTIEKDGTPLLGWLNALLNGESVENVG